MWSVLFFMMVITLGIDSTVGELATRDELIKVGAAVEAHQQQQLDFSIVNINSRRLIQFHSSSQCLANPDQFGGLESVITGLCDEYPRVLRAHRGIFIGLLIILIYLCSLPTTTYVSRTTDHRQALYRPFKKPFKAIFNNSLHVQKLIRQI